MSNPFASFDLTFLKAQDRLDRVARTLIFLFPIGAISVRHWVSSIFSALACLAIFRLRRSIHQVDLSRLEKVLLWLTGLFFLSYVVSSLVNGWDEESWRILGKELRFLAFIPLYVYLRSLPAPLHAFALGSLIAIPINLVVVIFQMWWLGLDRSIVGVYGSLFSGPATVLLLIPATWALMTSSLRSPSNGLTLMLMAITAAVAVQMSRSATLGLVVWIAMFYVWIHPAGRRYGVYFLVSLLLVLVAILQVDASRLPSFSKGIQEFQAYFTNQETGDGTANPDVMTSIGIRLELLKASVYIFLDHPLWGIGGYNFSHVINQYVDVGLLDIAARNWPHPHNVIAEVLVSKGIVGLSIFIGMFWVAFAIFRASRSLDAHKTHLYGMAYLVTMASMMMTEAAIVLKGNFIAVFLLFLGLFLAALRAR